MKNNCSGIAGQRFRFALPICLSALQLIAACNKSASPAPQPVTPPVTPTVIPLVVNSMSPKEGPGDTTVTITGTGFSATAAQDSVFFNGKIASIISATSTALVVTVPSLAGTGVVSVVVSGDSIAGPTFTYDYRYVVSTLAGSGKQGFADGSGSSAQFYGPYGVAADSLGNIYVADERNNRIRLVTSAGLVSTLAGGTDIVGLFYANGNGSAARFFYPTGVALDAKSNVYVADLGNNRIRMVAPSGLVSTLAGNGSEAYADGALTAAAFNTPGSVALDGQQNVYVADINDNRIRKITPAGLVNTLAGSGASNGPGGYADGIGTTAKFNAPGGLAVDAQGNIYVADMANDRIRKVTPQGVVTTLAGSGTAGYADGNAAIAQFSYPMGVVLDKLGDVYVGDAGNASIRMITPSGLVTTIAGNGAAGYTDGNGPVAQFNQPSGIAIDIQGNLYVGDYGNNVIRKITVQ
jgi:sugar lactone lactonase YvrE